MAIKYREAEELRFTTRKNLTSSPENWLKFLRTASNTYKYSYADQLMIAAQFPNATAVAPFDVWSDRFGRRIRAGEKGIGLIDDSGNYPKMKYVFDISQSDRFKDVPQPYVWDLQEEYKNDIILSLAGDLSITIEEAVSDFCENTVDSLLADYENAVMAESAQNNILTEPDEHRIKSDFRQALLESVKYVALTRCGLDTNYVDENIFGNMSAFSDVQIIDILGTAVSNISEQVLREIENTVKTIERRNQNEHNIEESGNNQRNTAFAERGGYEILPDSYKGQADRFDTYARSANIHISPRPDGNDRREGHRDLGTQENEVPEREENNVVSSTVRQPQADRSSDRDKRNSQQSDGQPDGRNDEKRGRDGETQSGKSDGVDTQNELDSEQSRRNRDEKSDTSIEKKPKQKRKQQAKKTEDTQSPVFFHTTHGEQMGLFPAEKTEKDRINEYAMSQLIKHGTGFEDGKFRVQEYFSQQYTKKEKAEFLSHEYGFGGYGSGIDSAEYRPNKGITMNHTDHMNPQNNMTVHLSYAEVAEMIDYLLAEDLYITPQDIENRQRKAINTIKNGDSNNPFGAYEIEKAKAVLDSYNIDYSQLLKNQPVVEEVTAEDIAEMNAAISDDAEIPDINNPAVVLEPTENLHTENAIITEFRRRTDESFHKINGLTASDIEVEVKEQLEWAMQENEIAGEIRDVVLYGSRSRGIEDSEKADIDILVEVDGADMKEYALFNFFEELFLEVDGIPVDVNPIRPEQTGTLEDYLPTAEEYLEQKQAEKQEQVGLKVPNDREKLIEEAKKRINDFVSTEYDTDGADFSNLSNINVAYTTTEDGEHEIQASIDLENTSVVRKVDDSIVSITKYATLEGFVEYLNNLDFPDLTYISDEQLKRFYEQENNSDEEDIKITSAAVMSEPLKVPEEQESVDSYLITDKTVSVEKYGYTVDFNTISEICFMEENDVYIGGLDGDGHERKDNYAVQQTEISFYLSDGYLMRHESENNDFPVTNEQAAEEMESLIQKALNDRDMLIRITDTEGNISFLDRSVFTIPEKEMPPDSISVSLGYSESPIIDDISERIQKSTEPLSFAAINAAFEYLDEKQHLERLNPHLKAGWYKKTDFEITGIIHGETFSYAGRFDIGDGKGTGGGSLIDHISDFVDYSLSPTNPLHLDTEKLDRQQKAKDILIPFLKEHTELTQAEQRFLNILKSDYPTGMTEEKLYSLVGKTIDYNDRQYVVDRIDIQNNTAHIRDDNTGWYPLFQDVELRDIVGQNIDLILDEKEQFFRDCDLPSLLAKSSLAWDEIESLGYIFFEKGHIDKYPPTVMAHYGNGSFAEPQVYELARQYQNGEDISKELTEKLFTANGRIPLTHIPFKDSYVEDLDLHIKPTDTGYFVNYGAYSREVTFEQMTKSYLQYFESEYDNIQKDVTEEENRETAKNMNFDFDTEIDKFYFHEDGVERIHYVPDDTDGGQFKTSQITYDDIIRANQDTKYDSNLVDKTMYFFEKFNDYATHGVIGIENEDFIKYVERFSQPHDLENAVSRTMFELVSKAEHQTELHSITPRDDFDADADKFFFTENGVEEIYFNPNSSEGGQFVICQISNELILEADKNCSDKNDFFSYLESGAYQILIDITNEEFNDYVDYFNRPANFEGGTEETMSALIARANRELRTLLSPENSADTFKIYQLKDGEENHYKRFEGLDRQPEPVSITDYNLVYEGKLADIDGEDKLESIYTKFNVDRPEDFRGHSLSVSDVVVTEQNGQKQAHFVDSVGFQNIPEFFKERTSETEEIKLKSIVIDLRPKEVIEAERQEIENISEQTENYSITDLSLGQRRLPEKFADNLAAIQTLKKVESEKRNATPDEQEILSKYTGWGGLSKVFEPDNKHYPEVKELLTDDEFAAARKSTMTAFYTSPVIIKEMYAKLAEMGFNGGKLLEPSCGIGNFIGMIPGNNTQVTGIELDSLTGRIAQQLYPKAQIQVCGFESSKLKENSFDVAVGNVPFGDIRIFDKQYNQNNLLIHDYFFSKSLDMVKPGGVVAFITSKGTLDKLDSTARKIIAKKGDFLGAVRLPNNAFKANAGTEVTSDIIFLKKRETPITITPENEPLWLSTAKDENGIEMNAYFVENPQQICGTMEMVTGQFGMESTCQPNKEIKLSEQIRAAMNNIQGKIDTQKTALQQENEYIPMVAAPESLRNSSYFISEGKAYFLESGVAQPVDFPKSKAKKSLEILKGMTALRDTVRQLFEMQLDEDTPDEMIKSAQARLSTMYDDFAKKFGRINDKANTDVFRGDSALPLLKSLEKFDEDGKYIGKADIFTKRTIKPEHTVTEVETSIDALAVSLSSEHTKGTVDLDYMSQLTGFSKEKIIDDLKDSIYKIPNTEKYVPADEYLSGDILKKLQTAERAFNDGDTSLAVNIMALRKAMPEKLSAKDIDVRLGSTWIKPEYIRDFIYDLLNTPSWHRQSYSKSQFIDVQFSDVTGKWFITNKGTDKYNVQGSTTYGTEDRTAYELIEDALNLKATTVKTKQFIDGKEKYVVDPTKTAKARAKQDLIMQKFKEWIFTDKSRRDDLVDTYNTIYNSSRPREYDGSHLNFVGMNPEITLRQHQLNAVARCLYGGNTLLAHEVGAGKSYEMIAAAMEGKRLGLHTKSLFCVPNHLTEQIGSDFLKLYPNANILVATKKDFEKENRKALMAKIATGNYDAIIIGHSQLEKIPLSLERQEQFIEFQIEETVRNIEELKAMNGERYQIKEAEKTKANLEAKLKKLLDSPRDDTVTFEELGIDKLFVDEAHLFKNLFLSTKMQNVSGVSTSSDVQKTADLFMKTQYLDEITGSKGVVFATGTPVSNTLCEMYNMQRYLQMDTLREKHLEHFDCWASTFDENVTQMELTPEGNSYRAKTRFSKFFNLPELMAMVKEFADIQTAETLELPGIPECEIHNVAVEPTEVQKQLVETLSKRAEAIHNRAVDPSVDNMLKITTDGRKIGLDQRLINPDLPDESGTKVNVCVDNVFNIWNDTADIRGTQLIFCDYSTPKNDGKFNVYSDIKAKLTEKGIPENQIAFIHDATNEVKREELFAKVRSGEIRVLIGSTSKMGAGTNVQDRLVASHDLDAPYRPADMEQRRGRMVRQGNKNSKVHLYRYCTKDTFDAYLFQMLERKQSFISQVMTNKSPQRRCDDIDEATLSYAEVKALCVGDPRIKEKMELDNELGRLTLERSSYQQEQYRLEDISEDIQRKIGILEVNIPKNQSDFLYIQKHPIKLDQDGKKIFEGITLHGTTYTDKKEAAEKFRDTYIMAIRQGGGHRDFVPVGEYRGFKIGVMFDSFSQTYKATLSREGTYYLDLGTDNFLRMDNVLDKLEGVCTDRIDRLAEHKRELKEVKEQIGKPFAKETEYQTKKARLAVLNAALDVDGKKNEQGGISQDYTPPVQNGNLKR